MHIPPFNNHNKPIIDVNHELIPLNYFNIINLKKGETFDYQVTGYETCIVPATGTVDINVAGEDFKDIGKRIIDVWDANPEGVYVPTNMKATMTCCSDNAEIFIAGAKFNETLKAFAVRSDEIDPVQYGSDDTKTHRKIKHILGQKQKDIVGRLLVSELYTVGEGGWSGFPSHKHDTDQLPDETRHDEVYNFRFKPNNGSGLQLLQREDGIPGEAYHVVDGSTFCIDKGYHPSVVMPGYKMYYFTVLGGLSQRGLVQNFQLEHAGQLKTIPGIMDMVAKFK